MLNRRTVKDYLIITVGTIIIAAAVYFFMLPSHVTVGSATALALVISNFIPLPVSVITFVINVILLIIGFFADWPGIRCQNRLFVHSFAGDHRRF